MVRTLYKKNKTKVQQWSIQVSGDRYRTTEGFVNGAMTTSEWTIAYPKNVGRKNATTGEDQAEIEAMAKIKLKQDKGYVDDPSGVGFDMFEPMLAHKYEDHLKKIAPYLDKVECSVFSQPKLDGMRCNIIMFQADGMLAMPYSRQGKPINNVTHISKCLEELALDWPNVILDGELYNHDFKDDFNSLISIVKKSKPDQDDRELSRHHIEYHVYDMFDTDNPEAMFSERMAWIETHLSNIPGIVVVYTDDILTQEQMDECYGLYREHDYEGQMIRLDAAYVQGRTPMLLKRKEFQDDEFEILDILEGVGNRSGMFGKFILRTKEGEQFESNARGNQEYYRKLLKNRKEYIGKQATVRFQNLTPRGVPRFPVVVAIRDYE